MLKRVGLDLQPHVDTIHLAAVETLRSSPDSQVIATGQRALETVIEWGENSSDTQPIVAVATLTQQAFSAALSDSTQSSHRSGHYIAAIVADLSRTIDAIDQGFDPNPYLEHARSLFESIPGQNGANLIEIDLSDRSQLEQLLEVSAENPPAEPQPEPNDLDLDAFRAKLAEFTEHAEILLESSEQPETIDGLVNTLNELQSLATDSQIEHVGRVVACALRVVESHRSAGESLPLDAVEFIIACRRIIPMILESLDNPDRVSHAVDALVDQSAFVLLELRRGTRPLNNLWPEPDEAEYEQISAAQHDAWTDEETSGWAANGATNGAVDVNAIDTDSGLLIPEPEPDDAQASDPSPGTTALIEPEHTIRVPIERIETLMQLAGELSVRSGGYNQRARKVLSVSQDINSIGDRLRYLVRAWNDGKYTSEQVQQHLSEITADLGLAAADLEHARNDHIAASERQADVRTRLEAAISKLRSLPLKTLTEPLEEVVADAATRFGRKVRLDVEGASRSLDALYAEPLAEAFRQLVVNAIEHGIELPDEREARGKPAEGVIRIKATRDGSQTVIQVMDDGAGLDESVVLERAEAAGYPVPRRGMTRDRALQYIFLPGFTTKQASSGDEVGMGLDYVSEIVSHASGSVTVHSDVGRGTVFTLRLPVAAMAMDSFVVAVSSERYAIPAAEINVIEPERLGAIEARGDGYRAYLDDKLRPAVDLGALLGVRSHHHVQSEYGAFVEVRYEDECWVLRVDRVLDQQAISLQPVGREYHHINGVVGTTTLASSEKALVLDIAQVLDASSRRSRRLSRQTASLSRVPFALISDDSISVRRQLAAALEQEGWRVIEARDAFEAREMLETIVPDLIVVDLDLPAHGGFQIAHAARNLGDMPVIGVTSRNDPEIRRRADSFNIDAYLAKPIDLDQFNETLARIMRGHQAGD